MTLQNQYDDWHKHVYDSGPAHADEQSPWYRVVLQHLRQVDGKRILEMACGRGGFTNLLAARGATMVGADFSGKALEIAREKARGDVNARFDLTQADASSLPFADDSFDAVVSCETIEHVPDPGLALREMARVCRPSGTLFLTTPNYFNAMGLYYVYARLRGRRATPGSDQPFDRVFLFPEIRRLLRQAGWKILASDGTVHQFPIRPGHNPVAVPTLEAHRLVRRLLSPLAFHYFVMARKDEAQVAKSKSLAPSGDRPKLHVGGQAKSKSLKYELNDMSTGPRTGRDSGGSRRTRLRHAAWAWLGLRPVIGQHTAAEHEAFARCASGRSAIVEIGVAEGVSALAMRQAMAENGTITLVDPFHLRLVPAFNFLRRAAHRAVETCHRGKAVWIERFSSDAIRSWSGPIDLLLIDGDHSEFAVRRDWDEWSKFVVPGGNVVFHDARLFEGGWTTPGYGPVKLVNDLFRSRRIPGWSIQEEVDSVVVVRRLH